jgi:hypothetical protein
MVRSHYDPEFCKQDEEVLQTLEAIGSVLIYSHTRILYASIDSCCLCLLLLGRYPGARRIGNADQLQPLLRRLNLMHLPNVPKQLCLSYASSHHQRYSFTNYQVILILGCRCYMSSSRRRISAGRLHAIKYIYEPSMENI